MDGAVCNPYAIMHTVRKRIQCTYLSPTTKVATGKRNLSDIIPCQIGSADGKITTDSDLTYCIGKFCVNKS